MLFCAFFLVEGAGKAGRFSFQPDPDLCSLHYVDLGKEKTRPGAHNTRPGSAFCLRKQNRGPAIPCTKESGSLPSSTTKKGSNA